MIRRLIKYPVAMHVHIVDVAQLVRIKTLSLRLYKTWILPQLTLGRTKLELCSYAKKLVKHINLVYRRAVRYVAKLTQWIALILFAPQFFRTAGRRLRKDEEHALFNVIRSFPVELIEMRHLLKRLKQKFVVTKKLL